MTPATARTLVSLAAPPALREAVVGDLEEEHRLLVERRGEAAAARWLRGQVLASLPRLVWLSLLMASGAAWLRATGIVAATYVAMALAAAWMPRRGGVAIGVAIGIPIALLLLAALLGARRGRRRGSRRPRHPPSEPPGPPPVHGADAA